MTQQTAAPVRNPDAPDETRTLEHGRIDFVSIQQGTVGRAILRPGWRWSIDLKPHAGTERCEVAHVGYAVSGRMGVTMADGTTFEIGPGEVFSVPAGHDAWVVGDEPCVHVDFGGLVAAS